MRRSAILLFLMLMISFAFAQNTEQILEVGHEYYKKGDYLGANKVYKRAMDVDSSDANVLYHYSKSLMDLMNMKLASRYLYKASLIDRGENYPDIYYLLAESYRNSGEYKKARRYYSKAILPYRSDRNSYMYKKISQSKKANQWSMKQKQNQEVSLNPFDPQFNTDASEFGARIIEGHLYFSSLRADSIKEDGTVEDQHYFNRIYYANLNERGEAVEISSTLNFKDRHLANLTLSLDGSSAYFSVCDTNYQCEIWKAKLVNNQLKDPVALNKNINFPSYNNTQAEVLEFKGKEYLIFCSDRPKGFGGLDLWISEKKKFGYDEPINLGSNINSPGNEITPYYQEGWIYFSSDWHNGFGGYDIFKTSGWISDFKEAENLGKPYNSTADDYYFSRSGDQAILTSNRSNDHSVNYCCNDLYFSSYSEPSLLDEMQELEKDTIVPDIITLNKYLPLDLFFHNDIPDPNSKDSTTNENYLHLAADYMGMKEEYLSKISERTQYVKDEEIELELESFFEDELANGIADLEFFTPLLLRSLQDGNQIELSIKGFASSVSAADYNLYLTLRRIESLVNYFKEYSNGAILPYLNGSAENGGSLKIKKVPFGEFAFSDQSLEEDKIMAVYSPQAAMQRKIELIAVSKQNGELKKFDSQEGYSTPQIEFNSKAYQLGEVIADNVNRSFIIKNTGGSPLEIYNIMINCECAQIEYPSQLEANEEGKIRVEIDTTEMDGELELTLTVVSNSEPNLIDLKITLEKK